MLMHQRPRSLLLKKQLRVLSSYQKDKRNAAAVPLAAAGAGDVRLQWQGRHIRMLSRIELERVLRGDNAARLFAGRAVLPPASSSRLRILAPPQCAGNSPWFMRDLNRLRPTS